eukprot:19549_1
MMSVLCVLIILSGIIPLAIHAQFTNWKNGSSYLPQIDSEMAVGYVRDNNNIWLMGGKNHPQHFVSFDINTNHITDHGLNYFTTTYGSVGGGQFYRQILNELWILTTDAYMVSYLNVYNFTEISNTQLQSLVAPEVPTNACLTSITIEVSASLYHRSFLIIIGGTNSTAINVLNIVSNDWITGLPSMTRTRSSLSCVAHNHKLYSFGGFDDVSQVELSTIESASVTATSNQFNVGTWALIGATLAQPSASTRAIQYAEDIIIIGGGDKTVHVLNTLDDTMSTTTSLQTAVTAPAFIHVDGVAYVFGGGTNAYQTASLHGTIVYEEEGPLDLGQDLTGSQGRTYHIPDIEITFDLYFESIFALAIERNILWIKRSDESYGYPRIYTDYSYNTGLAMVCVDWYDPDDFGGIEMVSKMCPESFEYIDRWHHFHFHLNGDYMYMEVDGMVKHANTHPAPFNEGNNPTSIWNIFIGQDSDDMIMKNIAISSRSPYVSLAPTPAPTHSPTSAPSLPPTQSPTLNPTSFPSESPTLNPTMTPSQSPTLNPTRSPSQSPTESPTLYPTRYPSQSPTSNPTNSPSESPTFNPITSPTRLPSANPTITPTRSPTKIPTNMPTISPTKQPTITPTHAPTPSPFSEQHVIELAYDTTTAAVMNDDDDGLDVHDGSKSGGDVKWQWSDILAIVFGCILLAVLVAYVAKKYKKKSRAASPQEEGDLAGHMDVEVMKVPVLPMSNHTQSIIPGADIDLPSEDEENSDQSSSENDNLYGGQVQFTRNGERSVLPENAFISNDTSAETEELFVKQTNDETQDGPTIMPTTYEEPEGNITTTS